MISLPVTKVNRWISSQLTQLSAPLGLGITVDFKASKGFGNNCKLKVLDLEMRTFIQRKLKEHG